ncbi:radiation-inducible immediate-early gene IEX-1 [Erpetoichthys calabaricus]|uniref:radiation-inducible immediate-early gene IEX-1 n=1 Tax=Erpetoichthys calabaricus TaxID=27687 RepID=UPI0022346F5D|nr:radiation-inducible immediate-early gene IEX-1 [Erpetoichthys calabaricus]
MCFYCAASRRAQPAEEQSESPHSRGAKGHRLRPRRSLKVMYPPIVRKYLPRPERGSLVKRWLLILSAVVLVQVYMEEDFDVPLLDVTPAVKHHLSRHCNAPEYGLHLMLPQSPAQRAAIRVAKQKENPWGEAGATSDENSTLYFAAKEVFYGEVLAVPIISSESWSSASKRLVHSG